jgi:hypothetical protein
LLSRRGASRRRVGRDQDSRGSFDAGFSSRASSGNLHDPVISAEAAWSKRSDFAEEVREHLREWDQERIDGAGCPPVRPESVLFER